MMKFSRRSITAGIGALLALPWLRFGGPVKAAEPVLSLPEGFIRIPKWCPDGFAPCAGQPVTAKQFPALFERNGKFYPMFFGRQTAHLPVVEPFFKDEIMASGRLDSTCIIPRTEPDRRVQIQVIAVRDHVWPSGRVAHAGFMHIMLIDYHLLAETIACMPDADDSWHQAAAHPIYWYGSYETPDQNKIIAKTPIH